MQSLFFWKTWPRDYRWLWFLLSGILIFSLIFLWISYFQGAHGIITWEKIQEQKLIETIVHNFRLGPFTLSVPGESYVILEYFNGSGIHHNTIASYIFLIVLIFSANVLLTIITTAERFWYFMGMSLFIIFIVSLQLDVLVLFGLHSIVIPIVIIALYVGFSFYFKSFRPTTSFIIRLFVFLSLTLLIAVTVTFFSTIEYPFLHIMATGYLAAIILSVIFILIVANEILISFIYVTEQGSTKRLKHFSLISAIYLLNVLIASLHEVGTIEWNFLYLNAYLLLSISTIIGIWGFRIREPLYGNIFSFSPFGVFFFVSLGAVCLVTIGQSLANANDATLNVMRMMILFSHTGFGIVFLLYFFSNFMVMMAEKKPVYKLLYRPNRMPYFTFQLAGLIATLAFVFYSNWHVLVGHSAAGFYNYVADLYLLQDKEAFAQSFYEQSNERSFQNNRANYALATIKTSRLSFEDARYNYAMANSKQPTAFSLINHSNLHLWNQRNFDALHVLRRGEKVLPNSPAILNNLGYAYGKIHSLDSATYYIDAARKHTLTKNSAEANFFAIAALERLPINTDSIIKLFAPSPAVTSNALALAILFDQKLQIDEDPLHYKKLNLFTATLLNNYIIRNAKKMDTTSIRKAYGIASDSLNATFSETLKASLANAYYHSGMVYKALEILGELAYITQDYKGKFNYIMGLWILEQNNPALAAEYFTHAKNDNYKHAWFYNAIALTEATKTKEALMAWDSVLIYGDAEERLLASQIKNILSYTPIEALTLSDTEKYQFCRYRIGVKDTALFTRTIATFQNVNYKAQALFDMAKKQYEADRLIAAIKFLNQISGLELTDSRLYDDIRYLELQMLATRKETKNLAKQINDGITFNESHALEKMLYTALISEANGDHKRAKENFEILAVSNPFFEEGIILASDFFQHQDSTDMKAYNTLVEAIHVNTNSTKLLKAYIKEATRKGFDDFATSATETLMKLEASTGHR
jgi:hypothetical protein